MNKIYALFYLIFLELKRVTFRVKYIADFDVTDNCNLRCKHCYHFHGKTEFQTKEIQLDVWKERLDNLYKKGIRIILIVGGEPALRQDVLMLADNIFPIISVITNGTIKIPGEFNHTLVVSLDGREERNDSIRGNGVFSKVMKNYSGDSRVIINLTLTEHNYRELESVVRIAKDNGFRGVVCNIHTQQFDENDTLSILVAERKKITNELKRVKSLYPDYLLFSKSMIKWYESPNHVGHCYWGDETLHFDVLWKARRCFTNVDCSNCGCLAGTIGNPLSLLTSPKLIAKMYMGLD